MSWGSTLLLLASVATVIGFLVFKGYGSFSLELVFGDPPPLEALLQRRPVRASRPCSPVSTGSATALPKPG